MAIRYPGAANHQLPGKSTTLLAPRIINVHTMVWDLASCERYFAQAGNPYSHFGTGPNGEVYQWQDLTYRAASDLNGNSFCISIENADKGAGYPAWSGSDVPRFTPAQAEAIAQLVAWLCVRFNIPAVIVPNSLTSSRGPGYHRHGINPWRVQDGILYSNSYGKVCPGDRRIAQFRDEIMPRVLALIAGPPPEPEDEDMPYILGHPNGTGYLVDGGIVTYIDGNTSGRYQDAGIVKKAVALNEASTADAIITNGDVGARLAKIEAVLEEIKAAVAGTSAPANG